MSNFEQWWIDYKYFMSRNSHGDCRTAYLAGQASAKDELILRDQQIQRLVAENTELERERDDRERTNAYWQEHYRKELAALKAQGDLGNHGAGEHVHCENCGYPMYPTTEPAKAQAGEPVFWYDEEEGNLYGPKEEQPEDCIPLYTSPPTTEPVKAQAGVPVAWLADTHDRDDPALFFDRYDAEQSGYSFVRPLYTHPTTERRVPEPEWIARLRHELMMAKMTHNFTFSRDETIALLNAAPKQEETK